MPMLEPDFSLLNRATISVPEAGAFLGYREVAAYSAARKGFIPTIKIGQRHIVVPVAKLREMLGLDPAQPAVREALESGASINA